MADDSTPAMRPERLAERLERVRQRELKKDEEMKPHIEAALAELRTLLKDTGIKIEPYKYTYYLDDKGMRLNKYIERRDSTGLISREMDTTGGIAIEETHYRFIPPNNNVDTRKFADALGSLFSKHVGVAGNIGYFGTEVSFNSSDMAQIGKVVKERDAGASNVKMEEKRLAVEAERLPDARRVLKELKQLTDSSGKLLITQTAEVKRPGGDGTGGTRILFGEPMTRDAAGTYRKNINAAIAEKIVRSNPSSDFIGGGEALYYKGYDGFRVSSKYVEFQANVNTWIEPVTDDKGKPVLDADNKPSYQVYIYAADLAHLENHLDANGKLNKKSNRGREFYQSHRGGAEALFNSIMTQPDNNKRRIIAALDILETSASAKLLVDNKTFVQTAKDEDIKKRAVDLIAKIDDDRIVGTWMGLGAILRAKMDGDRFVGAGVELANTQEKVPEPRTPETKEDAAKHKQHVMAETVERIAKLTGDEKAALDTNSPYLALAFEARYRSLGAGDADGTDEERARKELARKERERKILMELIDEHHFTLNKGMTEDEANYKLNLIRKGLKEHALALPITENDVFITKSGYTYQIEFSREWLEKSTDAIRAMEFAAFPASERLQNMWPKPKQESNFEWAEATLNGLLSSTKDSKYDRIASALGSLGDNELKQLTPKLREELLTILTSNPAQQDENAGHIAGQVARLKASLPQRVANPVTSPQQQKQAEEYLAASRAYRGTQAFAGVMSDNRGKAPKPVVPMVKVDAEGVKHLTGFEIASDYRTQEAAKEAAKNYMRMVRKDVTGDDLLLKPYFRDRYRTVEAREQAMDEAFVRSLNEIAKGNFSEGYKEGNVTIDLPVQQTADGKWHIVMPRKTAEALTSYVESPFNDFQRGNGIANANRPLSGRSHQFLDNEIRFKEALGQPSDDARGEKKRLDPLSLPLPPVTPVIVEGMPPAAPVVTAPPLVTTPLVPAQSQPPAQQTIPQLPARQTTPLPQPQPQRMRPANESETKQTAPLPPQIIQPPQIEGTRTPLPPAQNSPVLPPANSAPAEKPAQQTIPQPPAQPQRPTDQITPQPTPPSENIVEPKTPTMAKPTKLEDLNAALDAYRQASGMTEAKANEWKANYAKGVAEVKDASGHWVKKSSLDDKAIETITNQWKEATASVKTYREQFNKKAASLGLNADQAWNTLAQDEKTNINGIAIGGYNAKTVDSLLSDVSDPAKGPLAALVPPAQQAPNYGYISESGYTPYSTPRHPVLAAIFHRR
jgi:hypothetical protein